MVQVWGGGVGLAAALAVVTTASLLALSPTTAQGAEGEGVAVGGYLDLFPGGGGALALNPSDGPPLSANLGRLTVTDGGERTTLTYFTPRFSGFELGLGYTPQAAAGQQPADVPGHIAGDPEADGGLAIGGGLHLGLLGFGSPAAHAPGGGPGGVAAGLVTAGVGYDFGAINTNVTYGFTTSTVDRELDLFAVSADMAVVPGVAVTGGVAVSAEDTGDKAAAGMFGIRLNF